MNEFKVLASAIKTRMAYEAIRKHIEDSDFTEQGSIIWKGLDRYYSRDQDAGSCDPEILSSEIGRSLSSEKHKKKFAEIVEALVVSDTSPQNIVHDFLGVKREAVGARLATLLASSRSGPEVDNLIEEYSKWAKTESLDEAESQILRGMPLAEIMQTYNEEQLIRIWPSSLNNRLDGGLLRGHHVVVFARPEMGKTLFLVNAVAGFLAQHLTVLYVGNEDPIADIILRVVCRLTKKNKFEVLDSLEDSDKLARENGYDNLILAPMAPGTPREIEALVKEHKPDVLLIDQLRNIRMKEDNYVQQLEKAATAARNIAKRYECLVISVTQAGDSASGKSVLEMGDVDSSNTGIPAQADVMVGIGASSEDEHMGRRVISLPKNKRSGKHDYFPVKIDPALNRILGMGD